jgi:hypothetical protein
MALELRPNCECCDRDLPPTSALARICTSALFAQTVLRMYFSMSARIAEVGSLPAQFDQQLNGDPDFRLRNVRLRINGFIFLIARMRLLPTPTGLKAFRPKIDESKSTTALGGWAIQPGHEGTMTP